MTNYGLEIENCSKNNITSNSLADIRLGILLTNATDNYLYNNSFTNVSQELKIDETPTTSASPSLAPTLSPTPIPTTSATPTQQPPLSPTFGQPDYYGGVKNYTPELIMLSILALTIILGIVIHFYFKKRGE
jgi:parallel beta-helix repeat protein